jgi:hypothetical protein
MYGEANQLGMFFKHSSLLLYLNVGVLYSDCFLIPTFLLFLSIAFSMYNIAFTGLVTILAIRFFDLNQVGKIVIQTFSVFWGSCFCSLAFVLPRLLQVQSDNRSTRRNSRNSIHFDGTISGLTNNVNVPTDPTSSLYSSNRFAPVGNVRESIGTNTKRFLLGETNGSSAGVESEIIEFTSKEESTSDVKNTIISEIPTKFVETSNIDPYEFNDIILLSKCQNLAEASFTIDQFSA